MKRSTLVERMKLVLSILFVCGFVSMALVGASPAPVAGSQESGEKGPDRPQSWLATADEDSAQPHACICCKIHHEQAAGATCAPPPGMATVDANLPPLRLDPQKDTPSFRRVTVSSLVERALKDQRVMLKAKLTDLQRWDANDQAVFARWFGVSNEDARRLIHERVLRVLEVNKNYGVGNFRRANPPRKNVYAYVYANKPAQLYVDQLFVGQVATGENSRAGTITHEMSHFNIAGGTKDHAYGPANCKDLARRSSTLALSNADSFEYWAEGAR